MKISNFSSRLKEALQIRGFKAADLVERTQIAKSGISQYLSGKYTPKQEHLHLIAKALDVDEGWLMGYECHMDRKNLIEEIQTEQPALTRESQVDEAVKRVYGKAACDVLTDFVSMNEVGQGKLIGYLTDLKSNPDNTYREKRNQKLSGA